MIKGREGHARSYAAQPWQVLHEVDVARMVAQHAMLRRLCTALEDCADRLPSRDAVIDAASVSAVLADTLRRHEVVENAVLSSLFETDPTVAMHVLLARIRHRHAADHLHAEDLRDALTAAAKSPEPIRSDTLSYMMRCLFDGCRRGIDFQEAAILMLARNRLTPAARATLCASLIGAA